MGFGKIETSKGSRMLDRQVTEIGRQGNREWVSDIGRLSGPVGLRWATVGPWVRGWVVWGELAMPC